MSKESRMGKVSDVDCAAGMVQVVYHERDDEVTSMIPILSTVFSGVYSMPEVGDQVLVLHLSNGSEAGVVLGRPWSEKTKPPEGAKKLYRLDMDRAPGVAMVRYDGQGKALLIVMPDITIKSPVHIVGDVVIDGDLAVNGDVTVSGDVVAGGVSLRNHTHGGDSGGITTAPQ